MTGAARPDGRPAHHRPGGGFRNPWPSGARVGTVGALLRWVLVERLLLRRRAKDPPASAFPRREPSFAEPRARAGALSVTWLGHSSFLLQVGEWNVLVDPVWSDRASPLRSVGPRRHTAPGFAMTRLPPIDVVVLSHDHYDHLDDATVRALAARFPGARWVAPLGLAAWLRKRAVGQAMEYDWWERAALAPSSPGGPSSTLEITCVPAQHFSGRGLHDRDRRLWCGWTLRAGDVAVYFAGDSGDHGEWDEIARRIGPVDAVLMPIGAYEPRWFMRPVHMDADEAVAAFARIAAAGDGHAPVMVGMHWGTFKLTDEALDEPPRRARAAWAHLGLPDDRLWILAHGETRRIAREA